MWPHYSRQRKDRPDAVATYVSLARAIFYLWRSATHATTRRNATSASRVLHARAVKRSRCFFLVDARDCFEIRERAPSREHVGSLRRPMGRPLGQDRRSSGKQCLFGASAPAPALQKDGA